MVGGRRTGLCNAFSNHLQEKKNTERPDDDATDWKGACGAEGEGWTRI